MYIQICNTTDTRCLMIIRRYNSRIRVRDWKTMDGKLRYKVWDVTIRVQRLSELWENGERERERVGENFVIDVLSSVNDDNTEGVVPDNRSKRETRNLCETERGLTLRHNDRADSPCQFWGWHCSPWFSLSFDAWYCRVGTHASANMSRTSRNC